MSGAGGIRLRYGSGTVELPPGAARGATVLAAAEPPLPPSAEGAVAEALAAPVGSPPLRELLRGARSVAVPISDVTRYSATETLLPPLLAECDAAGIARERVTLFVARGTHRAMTDEEVARAVGPALRTGIRVAQSDPDGPHADLGTTSRGTPVRLFAPLAEHDRVVLTGTISFHYFAGFGGGRKALVPGCAARETAHGTHFRVFLPDRPGKHPLARPGVLAGNPVHEDLLEAASLFPPCFLVNTLLTPGKALFGAVAGHWTAAHEEGCARYASVYRVPVAARSPLVVASAGGYPKDINVIQSHKALDNAFRAVEPGGVLVLLAECRDGFGSPHFFPWFRFGEPEALERELRANYQIYGQTAHATLVKAKGCRVVLVSSLPPGHVEAMSMIPAASLADALERARGLLGGMPPPLVVPDAGYLLPEPPA